MVSIRRKPRKSSKAANLARRIVMVANGQKDRKPDSPILIISGKRLVKLDKIAAQAICGEAI